MSRSYGQDTADPLSYLASDVVVPLVHDRTRFAVREQVSGLADDPWERVIITRDTAVG